LPLGGSVARASSPQDGERECYAMSPRRSDLVFSTRQHEAGFSISALMCLKPTAVLLAGDV